MVKYRAYDAYQESGLDWLGKVPAHWVVKPLKYWITRNDGGVWGDDPESDDDPIVLRSTEQGVGGEWKLEDPARRKLGATDFQKGLLIEGDLLVTKSSGSELHIGKTSLVTPDVAALKPCYSNFMQRLRAAKNASPELIHYILNNRIAREQLAYLSNSTTGLANLNGAMIGQLCLAEPASEEQASIAAFLDHETAKIDSLIARQERLIELLKQKRQAVISHAVTKGLNPDAPMKDSGVEWLGEVPAHWKVSRLKYLCGTTKGLAFKSEDFTEDGEPVVKATDIKNKTILSPRTFISLELANCCNAVRLSTGDVLMSTVGSTPDVKNSAVGQVGMVPPEHDGSYLNQNTVRLEFNSRQNRDFLFLALQTQHVRDHLDLHAHGTANQASLSLVDILNVIIVLPNGTEQIAINEIVEVRLQKIDETLVLSEQSIVLLQEHRTALISAAVTGKIDVRGWKKPDIEPEETAQAVSA